MDVRNHSIGKVALTILIVGIAILLAIWTFRLIEKQLPEKLTSHPQWNTRYSPAAVLIGMLMIFYTFTIGVILDYFLAGL